MPSPTTTHAGLTSADVDARRRRDGPNELPQPPAPSPWSMFLKQLTHLLALMLWVAAGLALLAGMAQLAIAIGVILALNALFASWQEFRADRSARSLGALLPATTRVVRDGVATRAEVRDLVVDDVVLLAAGDRVGADMNVTDSRSFTLDESLMTGESGAVPRISGDRIAAGTLVMGGEATAVVVAVGTSTALAGIAALTAGAERPPSPLTHQLAGVVRVIAIFASITGVLLGVASVLLGLDATEAFLFGVGVSVALVPEGLLPTVTLSLARGARIMAGEHALVRRLDAVETLGDTSFICTDKTGTLTQNRMSVVEVVTPAGSVIVTGEGYEPVATFAGPDAAIATAAAAASAATSCVTGRVTRGDSWAPDGDPMEAAIHCLALRLGVDAWEDVDRRPYTADRLVSSGLSHGRVAVLGAPEAVLARSDDVPPAIHDRLTTLTAAGLRVLAVASREWAGPVTDELEHDLRFLGLLAMEDPPRPDVSAALATCRDAGIRVAMLSGDHPRTAQAIAEEVGLLRPGGQVLDGRNLPTDDEELSALLDSPDGAVVARVAPQDKLRIARVLRERGHVVAMTGDGVNDAPALREADVGVAMGASGSDVAREAADLVLLDDHFGTIVRAIELGRATYLNIRRFLTYHLTDNVAELTPFAIWALSGGSYPLAIGVLQVLALDIGTDMLPALALGGEPPRRGIMRGRRRQRLVDRSLLMRAFLVLGPTEALLSMATFTAVLVAGGWGLGDTPSTGLLAGASGAAFAAIAVGQMANAFACRSTTRPAWRLHPRDNPLVLAAVAAEVVLLLGFVGLPWLAHLLGGAWPSPLGWAGALATGAGVLLVDAWSKSRTGVSPRTAPRSARTPRPGTPRRGSLPPPGRA
jgi:magnesium-transporting ATPase (P-type)